MIMWENKMCRNDDITLIKNWEFTFIIYYSR